MRKHWMLLMTIGWLGGCDSSDDSTTAPWSADAVRLVAYDDGRGFGPPVPAGSSCTGESQYIFTVADHKLAWRLCRHEVQSDPLSPLAVRTGERVLPEADFQRLASALRTLTLVTDHRCGADKTHQTLTITTQRGETTYRDAFYKCNNTTGLWVDADPVFQVLWSLEPATAQ